MKKILIATTNKGKQREFLAILDKLPIQLVTPDELNINCEALETGSSFEEIAFKKAESWARCSNLPVLVDDSGLTIDALNGQPGIYSARFIPGSDEDRTLHVLELLKDTSPRNRSAAYVAAVAFFDPKADTGKVTTGKCEGVIAESMRGKHGFGYDPIFIPQGYTATLGELSEDIKNALSHRSQALAAMLPFLRQWSRE